MKTVMTFGTFDIFHEGHINFLQQAGKFGNFLIVVIARDETVGRLKGSRPENSERDRKEKIVNNRLADKVVLGSLRDKYALIRKYRPDIICLGYDQEFFIDALEPELEKCGLEKTKIVRLEPHQPDKYKSSKLKKK
jgi:FAD synthetase